MEKYEMIEKRMCMEMEAIEQKLQGGAEMSETDLKRIDMLAHAMKSLATYKAMKEAEEYGDISGSRGRGMNGRFVSRDGGNSYADGYARGYAEGMNQSGHWYPTNGTGYGWR